MEEIKEIQFKPDKDYDPLLDLYHNTRHASPRHQWLNDKEGWHMRSPWLSRFDWILDVHLGAKYDPHPKIHLTKQRDIPRTVFIKSGKAALFINQVLPAIYKPVVLYIGNGNVPPSECLEALGQLIDHPMVHQIFCEQKDVDLDELIAMPIGIHPRQMLANNAAVALRALALQVSIESKSPKVFGAWGPKQPNSSAWEHRDEAKRYMEQHPECCAYHDPIPLKEYWHMLSGYQFMLSPWGGSPDTSKTFEAFTLKTIPIIMTGSYAEAYKDLPVVVIEHLKDITPANLDKWWNEHSPKFQDMSFVSPDYWWRRIKAALPPRKKAFLVLGPESHGNHLMTDLLVHAGCDGSSGHSSWREKTAPESLEDIQPWDIELPVDQDPIVWRRSVPHLHDWPDIKGMARVLDERDYAIHAIVMTRDRHAALQSQVKWHHIDNIDVGRDNIEKAYLHIFKHLKEADIPYLMASYESLVTYPPSQDRLLEELGFKLPVVRMEMWDGNTKWLSTASLIQSVAQDQASEKTFLPVTSSDFPDHWFTCSGENEEAYHLCVRQGIAAMKESSVIFCGLARDVAEGLPMVQKRIERAGSMFKDYRVVIYENDSQDNTVALLKDWQAKNPHVVVLSENLGAKKWGQVNDLDRMKYLATCRNQYLEYVKEHFSDFEFLIVLDFDLPKGFSYGGLANTFGHDDWDAVGSNGLLVPPEGYPSANPMFFDAWAYREKRDGEAGPLDEINRLAFRRGEDLVPVTSCFGGLAVYRMEAIRMGAQYGGEDCEHVVFHRQLREMGFGKMFLNPSQIVLYSGKE